MVGHARFVIGGSEFWCALSNSGNRCRRYQLVERTFLFWWQAVQSIALFEPLFLWPLLLRIAGPSSLSWHSTLSDTNHPPVEEGCSIRNMNYELWISNNKRHSRTDLWSSRITTVSEHLRANNYAYYRKLTCMVFFGRVFNQMKGIISTWLE
jgi:hypothetical protein